VTVSLTPSKPGTYRVRATLAGAAGDAVETDVEVYVGGSGDTMWYGHDPNTLTVKLDKTSYKPGETATALVQSPFPNAELHLAVVRHGVLWETTQTTTSAAPTVRFQVTAQMLPNAAVEAFVVRRGRPPAQPPADNGNALARAGLTSFEVALDAKYLSATVSSKAAVLAPAGSKTVTIRVRDGAHRPVAGEVTLIVANDAVLQLTGYRPPDLVKTVYADQPVSTRFSDNRAALVLNTLAKPAEKGWGFGGGLSGDDADPRVRHAFSPLAYFAGALRTDANGVATATFKLPDDLTTWRAMVVATSADGRFGNAEGTFKTTKPLVANPVIPQFARPGDRFDAGVAVTNGTGATGTLHVEATLAGPLAFLVNDKPVASTSLDTPLDSITKAYRFSMIAQGTGVATATVRGAGRGDRRRVRDPRTGARHRRHRKRRADRHDGHAREHPDRGRVRDAARRRRTRSRARLFAAPRALGRSAERAARRRPADALRGEPVGCRRRPDAARQAQRQRRVDGAGSRGVRSGDAAQPLCAPTVVSPRTGARKVLIRGIRSSRSRRSRVRDSPESRSAMHCTRVRAPTPRRPLPTRPRARSGAPAPSARRNCACRRSTRWPPPVTGARLFSTTSTRSATSSPSPTRRVWRACSRSHQATVLAPTRSPRRSRIIST